MSTDKTKISSRGGKRAASPTSRTGKKKKQTKKKIPLAVRILLIVLCILLLVGVGLYAAYRSIVVPPSIRVTPTPVVSASPLPGDDDPANTPSTAAPSTGDSETGRKEGVYTILIMGHNSGLTDVMMVAAFDTVNGEIDVLSIPRDTYSDTDTRRNRKINGAYNTGGMDLVYEEVETLIGFRPDNYVMVDYDGFVELIDSIGGVEFDVPRNMYHVADDGTVDINLQKGYQHLNGQEALGLCRYRSGYASQDLGRIETVQNFLKAAADKAISTISIGKISEFVNIYSEYVDTDLSVGNIIWFMQTAWQKVDLDTDVEFTTLPVTGGTMGGVSYVFANEDEALEVVNSSVNPYTDEITSEDVSMLSQSQARNKYGS